MNIFIQIYFKFSQFFLIIVNSKSFKKYSAFLYKNKKKFRLIKWKFMDKVGHQSAIWLIEIQIQSKHFLIHILSFRFKLGVEHYPPATPLKVYSGNYQKKCISKVKLTSEDPRSASQWADLWLNEIANFRILFCFKRTIIFFLNEIMKFNSKVKDT